MTKIIPVYQPNILGNEKKYVNECIDSNWISSKGEFINRFEKKFSSFLNINHSTTVSNGTVALHLCLLGLDIKKGDEVILPTFTYIASVNSIKYVGAKPIFVDSDILSWNIDVSKIESKITNKTKAIMAVHLYGVPCEMDKLIKICKKYKIYLIEDTAEAFGSKYNNKFLGSFGDVSSFSFFGNKTITTGEGGMVCSKNKSIIKRVSYLKNQAVSPYKEYWHNDLGYNYRMTNISAAIGLAQVERANEIITKKKKVANLYKKELKNTDLIFQKEPKNSTNSYWMISVLSKDFNQRQKIRKELAKNNVESRPFFYPAHMMPEFKSNERFKNAENISKRGLNLPSYPDLKTNQINFICSIVKNIL